jgi:hypothetical protein
MTDLAPIVITASIVIVVLQIFLIKLILDMKKEKPEPISPEKPAFPDQRDFKRQRETENRFVKKSFPEHKTKPLPVQHQNQNTDHVERSLRDINLRLKNAEKDQEKERKRIKDSISHSSSPRKFDNQRPRERDDHFRKNDQSRQMYQQNRNDSPRPPREDASLLKNQLENRFQKPNEGIMPTPLVTPATESVSSAQKGIETASTFNEKPIEPVLETQSILPETTDNLHHGRKVLVKRRILNVEENHVNESEEANASKNSDAVQQEMPEQQIPEKVVDSKPETEKAAANESNDADGFYSAGPISFGR